MGNMEEGKVMREAVVRDRLKIMERREALSNEVEREDLEDEADLFEEAMEKMLN